MHTVYPHGSTDTLPFVTMGSGSLAAMSVFEADYKEARAGPRASSLGTAPLARGKTPTVPRDHCFTSTGHVGPAWSLGVTSREPDQSGHSSPPQLQRPRQQLLAHTFVTRFSPT